MDDPDAVAVIIVNYRTAELALQCVAALEAERVRVPGLSVIIVDGASGDGSAERLRVGLSEPRFAGWTELLALDLNGGFGWANNQAILHLLQRSPAPAFVHLLNPDAMIEPGAVAALKEALIDHPRCAAAGSQLLNDDGTLSGSAFRFPSVGREFVRGVNATRLGQLIGIAPIVFPPGQDESVDWVTGASVMLRSSALREAGLFDDGFFLYFEEVELMHRLRRSGWDIRHVSSSLVRHIGGASTGILEGRSQEAKPIPRFVFESRRRFFARAYGSKIATWAARAWLFGNLLWRVRLRFNLARGGSEAPNEREDMIRYALSPAPLDRVGAVVRWDQPPGTDPAWRSSQ